MTDQTITVSSAALAALLRDVRRAACDDNGLPMIAGVLLHTATSAEGKPVLAASATNRFLALHGAIPVSGQLPAPVFVSNAQLSQITGALRPYTSRKRVGLAEVAITLTEDGRVTVRQLGLDDLGDVAVTFPHNAGKNFPKMTGIIEKALVSEPSSEPWHVDAGNMAVFAQIAAARRLPLRLRSTGTAKPTVVQIGDELIGLLMPIRIGSDKTGPIDVPVYGVPVLESVEEKAA